MKLLEKIDEQIWKLFYRNKICSDELICFENQKRKGIHAATNILHVSRLLYTSQQIYFIHSRILYCLVDFIILEAQFGRIP